MRAWNHQPYSPERFAALLNDHAARTGERLPIDSTVLDYVPLMREPHAGVDDQDQAVWLIATADGGSRMLIKHPASDRPGVGVVLQKLADYNAAHRQLVQLLIRATKHNRENLKNPKELEAGLLCLLSDAADRDVDAAVLVKRDVSIALDD